MGGVEDLDGFVFLVFVDGASFADDGVVDGVECFGDVELSETAVGVGAVVVVDAVGAVGGLLDFGDEEAFAESVDATGWDVEDVALLRGDGEEVGFDAAGGGEGRELFFGDGRGEAVDELGAGLCVDDVPHFAFAVGHIAEAREVVVGMDLYGEAVVGVDDFDEEWEVVAEVFVVFLADEVAHVDFKEFGEVVVGKRAVGDDGFVVFDAREDPHLAAVWEGRVIEAERGYFVATPYFVFEEGEEFERIEHRCEGFLRVFESFCFLMLLRSCINLIQCFYSLSLFEIQRCS